MSTKTTRLTMRGSVVLNSLALMACLAVALAVPVAGQHGAKDGEWRHYGADTGSTKYSPLSQISKENVKEMKIVWRWKGENFGSRPDFNFEATPIMIGGVLYTTAGTRRDVVAIDAATGETLWMYRLDEGLRGQRAPVRSLSGRGVAYWTDGTEQRILHVTQGYRLVALDAKTGRPIPSFGKDGIVDLYDDLDQPRPKDGQIGWNSPPLVVRDVAVIGAALASAPTREFVKGYVRGYDVRTGKRRWIFHTVPQPGEVGHDTWENDSWTYTGHTGVWSAISADEELGYVYLPVESPTHDTYGGFRPGANLFANSVVCVDASTGKRIWHFQLTHHDLWDYDLPAPPMLLDITVDGRRIKALAQLSKQGFTYVFDRVTGKPVWPIEEKPVPQSDVPGEKTSLTQPFPSKPAPFERQGTTPDVLIDFTPQLKAEALKIASQYRLGPLFSPPMVVGTDGKLGTLSLPGHQGGSNWQGGAADPETGIIYITSSTSPFAETVNPADLTTFSGKRTEARGGTVAPATERSAIATAVAGHVSERASEELVLTPTPRRGFPVPGPQGLPLVKPPWGRITAINLNTGEHVWMVPNGNAPEVVRNHPALKGVTLPKTGRSGRAGIIVTKTLVFAGEGVGLLGEWPGAGGPMFRAYDKLTGAVLAELELPANQSGVPMTYMVNGRQFVVVAVGGVNKSAELVALSVP